VSDDDAADRPGRVGPSLGLGRGFWVKMIFFLLLENVKLINGLNMHFIPVIRGRLKFHP